MRAAQLLTLGGAIDVSNEGGRGSLEGIHQLVPIGLQLLAVASPRCLELNEHRLAGDLLVPCLWGQLKAACHGGEAKQNDESRHIPNPEKGDAVQQQRLYTGKRCP